MNEVVAQRIVEIMLASRKLQELTAGQVEDGEIARAFWHIAQIALRGVHEIEEQNA
jgi:hypothetical protein